MVSRERVATGKSIHRRTGGALTIPARFLPRRVRRGAYVTHGFCRVAREAVDDPDRSPEERRAEVERLRAAVLGDGTPRHDVVAAFETLRTDRGIPDDEVERFLDAMATDAGPVRFETADDLDSYLRGAAVAPANVLLALTDATGDAVASHVASLARGMARTRLIRDVGADLREHDRVYVPTETLRSHGVTVDDLRGDETTKGLTTLLQSELSRAEDRYREGVAGIQYLPRDCQYAVTLGAVLAAEHHHLVRKRGFDVLPDPPTLGRARQLYVAGKTSWRWWRTHDPETVFRTVSAVPADRRRTADRDAETATPR